MLSVRTTGCVNSHHMQQVWPNTPSNEDYIQWHSMMMQGLSAVEITAFRWSGISRPQKEIFRGFPAYAVHNQLAFDCVDVVGDSPCSPEKIRSHLTNFGAIFSLTSMYDDQTQMSTMVVLDALEGVTHVNDAYSIGMSMYSFLDTNAVIMNYIRGSGDQTC